MSSRFYLVFLMFVLVSAVALYPSSSASFDTHDENNVVTSDSISESAIVENAQRALRMQFYENIGQIENSDVRFYSEVAEGMSGPSIAFTDTGVVYRLISQVRNGVTPPLKETQPNSDAISGPESIYITLRFDDANAVAPTGRAPLEHTSSYFFGNDQSQWHSGVQSFREVVYHDLYDNIDLTYYFSEEGLKYEFVVQPGGNPDEIKLRYEGIDGLTVDAFGSLVAETSLGPLIDKGLCIYQDTQSGREEVAGRFAMCSDSGTAFGFLVDDYDSSETLVIDPLLYSTFIGGSSSGYGWSIAVDTSGNAYVTGPTWSSDFPTVNAYDDTHNGNADCFVFKLNSTGNGLLYSTFIGGSLPDSGRSIAFDSSGNAYVTGYAAPGFPTINAYDNTHNGNADCFVFKLNSTGNGLLYSTFIGGSDGDIGESIAIDLSGNAYVTGAAESSDFPTVNSFDDSLNGNRDCFVFKLNSTGNGLLYSTFIGGSNFDASDSITVDSSGNAYVTGYAYSSDFPTVNAFDDSFNGSRDCFVLKLNSTGNGLQYSTFLGGSGNEDGYSVAVDSSGNAYVTGSTQSSDFPTVNAYNSTYGGITDCFVSKLNSTGNGLLYSTFIGGSNIDASVSITVDSSGNAYVTGSTQSSNFPTVKAYDNSFNAEGPDQSDCFVSMLNSTGNELLYSTFIGGSSSDSGYSIAVDSSSYVSVTGYAYSSDFPTVNAFDNSHNGGSDGFVFKLLIDLTPPDLDSPIDLVYEQGTTGNQIAWITGDSYPYQYRVDGNGTTIGWTAWTNGTISLNVTVSHQGSTTIQ